MEANRRLRHRSMNPVTNIPASAHPERPRDFLRRVCLAGHQPPARRPRALAMRLRELGFRVHRIVRRNRPVGNWDIYVRPLYDGFPPPVDVFRDRLRRALRALCYRCPKARIRIRRRGLCLKMSFPWPDEPKTAESHERTTR